MPNVTKPVPIGESSDVVHDDTTGGTDGNPHTLSAELDDTGVLRAGQVPGLAITNTSTVATESDLTGLDAEQGDVGIVTDTSQAYILTTDDPATLGNWSEIKSPPAPVDDVFGRTGSVNPQSGDYSASEIADFASEAAAAAPVSSVNGSTGDVSVAGAEPLGLTQSEFDSYIENSANANEIAAAPVTMGAVASSAPAMDEVAASATARNAIGTSGVGYDAIGGVAMAIGKYTAGIAGLTPSNFADIDAVVSDTAAMDAVAASQTARDAVSASQLAFDTVAASNMAIGKFVAGSAGLTPSNFGDIDAVAASQTAMDAVAASATAMGAVVASQTAMDAVAASQTAMDAVAASATAMDAVVASQTAMDAVSASATAMDAVAASATAMDAVAASQTAMDAVAASATAMEKVGLSDTAQNKILNSNTAINSLNAAATTSTTVEFLDRTDDQAIPLVQTEESYAVYFKSVEYTGYSDDSCLNKYGVLEGSTYLTTDGGLVSEVFIDNSAIGWDGGNCSSSFENLSAIFDAVQF